MYSLAHLRLKFTRLYPDVPRLSGIKARSNLSNFRRASRGAKVPRRAVLTARARARAHLAPTSSLRVVTEDATMRVNLTIQDSEIARARW